MRYYLFATMAVAGLMALPALAQPPEDGGKKGDRPSREEMRERMIKEFDKDGDGKLSDEEREKAREAMRERFGRRGAEGRPGRDGGPRGEYGKGKKGDRGPDGRRGGPGDGPRPPHFERLFDRFDEDKNDALSRKEFKKLAEFVREHRPGPPGGPRRGPRFDGRGPDGPPRDGEGFRRRPRSDGEHGADRPGRPRGDKPKDDSDSDDSPKNENSTSDSESDETI